MFGGEWMIVWAFVITGLFVVAAGGALVSFACNRLAERLGTAGWRTVALWTERVAQVLTFLLILAVIGTTFVIAAYAAYFLLPPD